MLPARAGGGQRSLDIPEGLRDLFRKCLWEMPVVILAGLARGLEPVADLDRLNFSCALHNPA